GELLECSGESELVPEKVGDAAPFFAKGEELVGRRAAKEIGLDFHPFTAVSVTVLQTQSSRGRGPHAELTVPDGELLDGALAVSGRLVASGEAAGPRSKIGRGGGCESGGGVAGEEDVEHR